MMMTRSQRRNMKKRRRKRTKKTKKNRKSEGEGETTVEEGEVKEEDLHPLVTLTNINPEEIPDVPTNKFLMRGAPSSDKERRDKRNKDSERRDDRKVRDRLGNRQPDWRSNNNRGYNDWNRRQNRNIPATTKSGRIIKGRGVFRYRTPSRSRSRSATPMHWKKAQGRVIKLTDFEKKETERKQKEEERLRREAERKIRHEHRDKSKSRSRSKSRGDQEENVQVDYNALDYEDNNDQSDKEDTQDKSDKQELIQYPPPGSFNPVEKEMESKIDKKQSDKSESKVNMNQKEEYSKSDELVLNKRSEVLAMALGVQIKTGEDPPTGEISISGYEKKRKHQEKYANNIQFEQNKEEKNNKGLDMVTKLMILSQTQKMPRSEVHAKPIPESLDEQIKPVQNNAHREQHDFKRGNRDRIETENRKYRRPEPKRRSMERDRPNRFRGHNSRPYGRMHNRSREKSREYRRPQRRSPRHSREKHRSRSRDRGEKRRIRRSESQSSPKKSRSSDKEDRSKKKAKSRSKEPDEKQRKESEKKVEKKVETAVEKMKRRAEQLLILKKKMELEILEKRRKEGEEKKREQEIMEEKQRKAKEEADMLEKAKKAKREALEKEKLLEKIQAVKVLKELDRKAIRKPQRPRSSSSESSSSSGSSSSPSPRRRRAPPRGKRRSTSSSSTSRSRSRTPKRRDARRK